MLVNKNFITVDVVYTKLYYSRCRIIEKKVTNNKVERTLWKGVHPPDTK